jgi:hypothetical protein
LTMLKLPKLKKALVTIARVFL